MENIMLGIRLTIIGMGITFASLYLLSLIVELLHRITSREKKDTTQAQPVVDAKLEPAHTAEAKDQEAAEVVAVIASALAAYLDTAPASVKIRIVRRQIPSPFSTWSMAGRQELMNQHRIV
jgi:sodium pump decarboxylase gamma subunit